MKPIEKDMNPADYAVQRKLIEFSPEQAKKFSPEGGRVFTIPTDIGNAVLILHQSYEDMCGVAIRETDAVSLWKLIHESFSKKNGFRLQREIREEAQSVTRKDFYKQTGAGPVILFVSLSDKPRAGNMQALFTLARVREKAAL